MFQTAVMAGLTVSELAVELSIALPSRCLVSRTSSVAPRIPPPAAHQRLPAPSLRQVEGGQVQQERQQRQHEAEVAQRADEVLEPAQLAGLHHDELAGVLNRLTVEQVGDARLERGERWVELDDVRLARILEHRGGLPLHCGQPLVELGQAALEVGQLALELGGGLRLDARDLLLEARDGRLELGGIRFESREVLLRLRGERARLRLGERCSRRLDLALHRRQALLELRRGLLDEALDLGDRRGVNAQASGKLGDEAPVFEGDDAALGRDELALVLDQVDEPLLRPIDRGGDEFLNSRRGERRLRHVRSELSRRRRDWSGERLGGRRQLLLDLGLDVDVGVELVDREDAELLLDVLVLEDLLGAVGELAAVEDLGLNPVREHRDAAAPPTPARRGTRRGRGDDASALPPRDVPRARCLALFLGSSAQRCSVVIG